MIVSQSAVKTLFELFNIVEINIRINNNGLHNMKKRA